jgi:hypothetical protein
LHGDGLSDEAGTHAPRLIREQTAWWLGRLKIVSGVTRSRSRDSVSTRIRSEQTDMATLDSPRASVSSPIESMQRWRSRLIIPERTFGSWIRSR